MDANRLARIRAAALEKPTGLAGSAVHEVFAHIDQQQAEIERLNRAYEVLERGLHAIAKHGKDAANTLRARGSLDEAHRIKNGKDGEQG